jgi:Phosphotransferase enzyme family
MRPSWPPPRIPIVAGGVSGVDRSTGGKVGGPAARYPVLVGDDAHAGPRRDGTSPAAPPDWLAQSVDGGIFAAQRARWGFRHETWRVELGDGRMEVIQRRADGSDPTGPGPRMVRTLVRGVGLPVPEPLRAARIAGQVVVSMPWIEGTVAAELLGTPEGAAIVGRLCGEIDARFGWLDPNGISSPRTWAGADALRAAMGRHLDGVAETLPASVRRDVRLALDRAASEVDRTAPRVVHGDLAPVNVLVRDGRLAAVLDLDRVQLAHPLYDAAWFAWIVSFHHPGVADLACDAFALAAGRSAGSRTDLAWLWPLQLLERFAEAPTATERATWQDRLTSLLGVNADGPG